MFWHIFVLSFSQSSIADKVFLEKISASLPLRRANKITLMRMQHNFLMMFFYVKELNGIYIMLFKPDPSKQFTTRVRNYLFTHTHTHSNSGVLLKLKLI